VDKNFHFISLLYSLRRLKPVIVNSKNRQKTASETID
jgi:hypothetical protein